MNHVSDEIPWPLRLFHLSPLKQKKYQMISDFLPRDFAEHTCLDIGSDNGVISYLLRQKGGIWTSVDLTTHATDAIRKLVRERVCKIEQDRIDAADSSYNLIVIVDLLEHLEEDGAFIDEMKRLLVPNGDLIINVPNPKEGLLRKFRFFLGQTDEQHGHVRPGYSLDELKRLLGDDFEINKHASYSRLFSQLVDTFILAGIMLLGAGKEGKKGAVVTEDSLKKKEKELKIFSYIAPFLKMAVKLDDIFSFFRGSMLIVSAKHK